MPPIDEEAFGIARPKPVTFTDEERDFIRTALFPDHNDVELLIVLVCSKIGKNAAKSILKTHGGCSRVSEVLTHSLHKVGEACREALMNIDSEQQPTENTMATPYNPIPDATPTLNAQVALVNSIKRETVVTEKTTISGRISIGHIEKLLCEVLSLPLTTKFDWCYSESQEELLHLDVEYSKENLRK